MGMQTGTFAHLEFNLIGDTGKTEMWEVAGRDGCILGQVKWHTPWRKYCFFPEADTVFDTSCHNDIDTFIDKLMVRRKKKRKQKEP